MELVATEEAAGLRLDAYLATSLPELSRANWQKLIKENQVHVNDQPARASLKLAADDVITYTLPIAAETSNFDLPIIYKDANVIVINKPPGVLVHPNNRLRQESTVIDILAKELPEDGSLRPGVVHRLDRDTSGVMILARNTDTRAYLQKQFQNRTVVKTYHAVCEGTFRDKEFLIDAPLRRSLKRPGTFMVSQHGKPAQTRVRVLKELKGHTLVELMPKTGRTHQLRVHLKYTGHPIVGDRLYGTTGSRLLLHASELTIATEHNKLQTFSAPLPTEFTL